MTVTESPVCAQLSLDVTRYVFGELPEENKSLIETHLVDCPPCSKRVAFVRKFTAQAKEQSIRADAPDEPCPDTSVIVALETDELGKETAQHVRAHLLFCKLCREEYILLRRLSNELFEEKAISSPTMSPKLGDFIFQVAQGNIKSLGNSGAGQI